jgi:peroxiredoxin Q/BCP
MSDVGDMMPDIALETPDGGSVKPSDFRGQKLVVFFYPKDDTPGCTQETCDFQSRASAFAPKKAVVLGVSILDEKSKAKFAGKYGITFPLLADVDHGTAEKYGVWQEKSRYGRTYMGIVRTTYLVGPDGKIARRWDNVKVDGHADEVAKAAAALQ